MGAATLNGERSKQSARRRARRWNRNETLAGYLFILPSIIGFTLFVLYPLLASCYYAFTKWDGISAPEWVGLENFHYLFTADPTFGKSLLVTALFVLLTVPPSLAVGLGLALLLNRKMPGIALFRTIFYLPAILPSIATLTIWKFVFNPQFGLANALLTTMGLPTSLWLGSEQAALPTMALIGLWGNVGASAIGGVGGIMIIFLGALQAVPQEMYEAAEMDGAGRTRMFLRMTLPMISPIIFLQLVLQIIAALQAFNQPAVLTKGGPNDATNLLMFKIYTNGFGNLSQYPDLGYAIAQVLVLFALIVAVTTFTFRFSSMWVYEDSTVE